MDRKKKEKFFNENPFRIELRNISQMIFVDSYHIQGNKAFRSSYASK